MARYVEVVPGAVKAARWFNTNGRAGTHSVEISVATAVSMPDVYTALQWVDAMTSGQLNEASELLRDFVKADLGYDRASTIPVPAAPTTEAAELLDSAYCLSLETCARFGSMPVVVIRGADGPPLNLRIKAVGRTIPRPLATLPDVILLDPC
jgi:hypothetical protein